MDDRFERFAVAVAELNRYLQRIKEQEMSKFGLRASHAMCIYYLGQNREGLTVTQLSQCCKEDKAAISRCMAQLLERKLVVCDLPKGKRAYRTPFRLTEDGANLAEKVNDRVKAALEAGGSGMTGRQRETFYRTAQLILDNLSRYGEKQPT